MRAARAAPMVLLGYGCASLATVVRLCPSQATKMLACEHPSVVFLWCLVACEMRVAVSQNVAVVGWGPAVNPLCQCVSNVRPSCESPCLALGAALRRLLNISISIGVAWAIWIEGGSVIIENALLSDQSVSHVSSELTSTMEQSNVVRTHEFTARDRCIHTSGTTRFCTSLGAGFGANGRCHEACKARQSTQHTPGHHILPLARPQTTARPISAPTASRCF